MGVNAIRMHKFAYSHSAYGNPENSTELTKEGWNKLDYYWSRLKEKGYFTVNTPGTKAIAGFTSGQNIDLDDISIQTDNPFTIVYITSLDKGKSIENSSSILVTTIARARNSGMKYTYNNNETVLKSVGGPPLLVEPVNVNITFEHPQMEPDMKLERDVRWKPPCI